MKAIETLRHLDEQRRNAMIAADGQALDRLLADDLIWTHSSGVTESKAEVIVAIVERRVVYQELVIAQDHICPFGAACVHQGVLSGRATRDGQEKRLFARFLAVWCAAEDKDSALQLTAWQTTNCSLPSQ